jgi:arsenate reductase-like glutaredoxin family protein
LKLSFKYNYLSSRILNFFHNLNGDLTLDYIIRNYRILRERMIEQMEHSLELGKKLIDTELDTGLLNFIIKPLVKTFYDYWSQNFARNGTIKQIKITLDSGKELLLNSNLEKSFEKVIEQNFPRYFNADQTSRWCYKDHRYYEKLKQITKETFINYVKEVIKLLNVKEDIESYGDLCRVAFKSREDAEKNLMKQLYFTDAAIKLIEENPSMINIPIGKKIIINALRHGFEATKIELIEALNDTYNQE